MADGNTSASFHIISSLRYDPALTSLPPPYNCAYYLLRYHYDRLLSAAIDFQWTNAASLLEERGQSSLSELLDQKIPSRLQPWRIRILLDRKGEITLEFSPLAPSPSNILLLPTLNELSHPFSSSAQAHSSQPWTVRLDSQSTPPSLFTRHKTTRREAYNASRQRAGIGSFQQPVEVLLYSPSGEVMEGSITTPYFKRSRRQSHDEGSKTELEDVWVTPPLTSGGNAGTTRRYALAQGLCVEEVVGIDELVNCEQIWLSNGVSGFIRAVLKIE
ncbi:Aminodeoxychorismate lyase [Emydomyces testavorans]|uniref:Aminodeoxychorismate lyase n=1 Tax=Emydomyces testavorans TaxID=2070801 RepID=A0AAF0DKA2_9EURO|nr:Aminodeoxychorismate lyase [Emydomyces testavorans]